MSYTRTYTHTHTTEYYSAIKMNEIMPFASVWMDFEGIMPSEKNHTLKGKYHMSSVNVGKNNELIETV